MSLEGLRAWIGEVERKLAKRTRVFLALSVIAIGLGGAAIYLAIDARESSVSESDVQELQQRLEAQIDEAAATTGAAGAPPLQPEAEPAPESGSEAVPAPEGNSGTEEKGSGGVSPEGATGGIGGDATGGKSKANIGEQLEQAQEQNAAAEAEQGGK